MKTIHVVGNAISIRDESKKYGKLIDTGECVIRFNRNVQGKLVKKYQGKKTDVVVFTINPKPGSPHVDVKQKWNEVWYTADFPEKEYLNEVLGTTPSSGIIILERLKNKYPNACVRIFGFDWKATDSFFERRKETKHDYKGEEEYCRKLIKENNWE